MLCYVYNHPPSYQCSSTIHCTITFDYRRCKFIMNRLRSYEQRLGKSRNTKNGGDG
ncbi:hypothetical protein HanRHA438_Chr11g0522371 [Helianthus annuus]|nr:hypothetical protein HanRHA438_Chr11g0522371 [Helianthus annuus]